VKRQMPLLPEVWFWQLIISPHMAELAVALARQGCRVVCVASQAMSSERSRQGWIAPNLSGVTVNWAESNEAVQRLVASANEDSIHLCQGIRANGRVALAQKALAMRGLKQFAVMETVEDSGWRGLLKRQIYRNLFRSRKNVLSGVLAIGYRTMDWIAARGMPAERVFPFAYFLSDQLPQRNTLSLRDIPRFEFDPHVRPFRFIFVGRLIPLKRVDWLINALGELKNQSFELWIVGAGSEEAILKEKAAKKLGKRVRWLGQIPMTEVPSVVGQADCLVLPSVHDGWGAVCSEALMAGTPVICSDACGVSGVVRASGVGGVFPSDNVEVLRQLLARNLDNGCVTVEARGLIAQWAQALGATAGASYLLKILNTSERPMPPWQREKDVKENAWIS